MYTYILHMKSLKSGLYFIFIAYLKNHMWLLATILDGEGLWQYFSNLNVHNTYLWIL